MNRKILGLAICALVLVAGHVAVNGLTVGAQAPGEKPLDPKFNAFMERMEIADGDGNLQKKLKERHNAAVAVLSARVKEYQRGVKDQMSVLDAARLVVNAKVDMAEDQKALLAALQQSLEIAQLNEDFAQRQIDRKFGDVADLEFARYLRLTVEVDLIKAQQPAP
jgi:hypothetical protein